MNIKSILSCTLIAGVCVLFIPAAQAQQLPTAKKKQIQQNPPINVQSGRPTITRGTHIPQ